MTISQHSLRPPILFVGIKSLICWTSKTMFYLALLHSASIPIKSTAKMMKNTGFLWYISHLWNMLYVLEKYRFLLSITANSCSLYYIGPLCCIKELAFSIIAAAVSLLNRNIYQPLKMSETVCRFGLDRLNFLHGS